MKTSLFFSICFLIGMQCPAQELIGQNQVAWGTLVSFEVVPAQEASWHIVTPSADDTTYQVDTGTSRLYFASPVQGRYTVIAGIALDGKPKLLTKTFVNGGNEEQALPPPPTEDLETWIKTQIPVLVKSQNPAQEVQLVSDCFDQIVRQIDEGTIKTASNALTQIQIAITSRLALSSPTAVTDWIPFLKELSRELEKELAGKIDELAEVRAVFQRVCDAMRSLELPKNIPIFSSSVRKKFTNPLRKFLSK